MMTTVSSDGVLPPAMARNFMAEFGGRLITNGYPILPIMPGTKSPGRWTESRLWQGYKDWSKHCTRPTKAFELDIWKRWPGCGVGVACGLRVRALDIDLLDEEAALRIEQAARLELGDTPCIRIGRAPKRLLVYRAATSFPSIKKHPLEFLGEGAQFVAYAVHPDTGQPYFWPHEGLDEVDFSRLPEVTEEQCRRFMDAAYRMVPEKLRQSTLGPDRSADYYYSGGDLRGTREAIQSAIEFIPNDDLCYQDWMNIGMALKGALGEDAADIYDAWSAKSKKYDPDFTARNFASYKPERIGAGTIYGHALSFGWVPDHDIYLNPKAEEAARSGAGAELFAALTSGQALPAHDPETGEILEPAQPTPGSLPVVIGEQYRGLPRREMLVKGLFGIGELSVTYGAPKTGKSFLLTSCALAIACGDPDWFGYRIKRSGLVIYCIMEGVGGFPNRLAAWSERTGRIVPNQFAYVPVRLRFLAPEGTKPGLNRRKIIAEDIIRLQRLVAEVEAQAGQPCVMLVIDTVARAMTGRDENSTQDMGEFVDACGELQNLPNRPHVALVHHESKSGTMRGSSALLGAGDTMVHVERAESGERQWSVEFSKDDADGKPHAFDLEVVTIDRDEDGDEVTSCVIRDEGAPSSKANAKPPSNTEKALAVLSRVIAKAGIEPPEGYDIPVRVVATAETWRIEATKIMAGETPESRAAAFRNARKKLFDEGLVAAAGQFVWLAEPGAQSAAQIIRETKA